MVAGPVEQTLAGNADHHGVAGSRRRCAACDPNRYPGPVGEFNSHQRVVTEIGRLAHHAGTGAGTGAAIGDGQHELLGAKDNHGRGSAETRRRPRADRTHPNLTEGA